MIVTFESLDFDAGKVKGLDTLERIKVLDFLDQVNV